MGIYVLFNQIKINGIVTFLIILYTIHFLNDIFQQILVICVYYNNFCLEQILIYDDFI